jgi:LacI family transcriptional regulator, repressor for deo operon, udp, cdd, tsx, nupC, and nupG
MTVIKDVAHLAGVSPSTVSKYLNNASSLTQEYKERVAKAIEALHYTPSNIARSMRTGRKNLIAVIVPSIDNPFYSELYNAIRVHCTQKGYTPIIYTTDENPDTLGNILSNIAASPVDGVILCFLDEADIISRLEELHEHTPVVVMGWHVQSNKFSSVISDVFSGIYKSTYHLIELGHENIAYISGRLKRSISGEKLRAFKKAMFDANLPVRDELIFADNFRYETGYHAASNFMHEKNPPTGIVAANDVLALGCVKYLINNNYRVPEDVAVIGFDGIQLSSLYDPSISTVAQPITEMGQAAGDMIIARIEKPSSKRMQAIFQSDLVIRKSTDKNAPIIFEF